MVGGNTTLIVFWSAVGIAALIWLLATDFVRTRSPLQWVGPMERKGRVFDKINIDDEVFKGKKIDLTDFTRHDFLIRNKVFLDCDIVGPAVIALFGPDSLLKNCYFDHPKPVYETFLWPDPEEKRRAGTVLFEGCQFSNCRLLAISITDSPERIATMRQKIVVPTYTKYTEPGKEEAARSPEGEK